MIAITHLIASAFSIDKQHVAKVAAAASSVSVIVKVVASTLALKVTPDVLSVIVI